MYIHQNRVWHLFLYLSFQAEVKAGCMITVHSNHLNNGPFCLNQVSTGYTVLLLVFDKNMYNTTVSKAVIV